MMWRMRIATNFDRFPTVWSVPTGGSGESTTAHGLAGMALASLRSDIIIINTNAPLAMKLAALFTLAPFLRKPVVVVDLVLRVPQSEWRRLAKKWLLSRVDFFLHYFKDLTYYEKYYGIGPDQSGYVAFKPNLRYRHDVEPNPDGDYVLCLGFSMRDYDTFFDAVATLPYPAAIPTPNFKKLHANGSRFSRRVEELPPQVSVLDDDGTSTSLVRMISGARVVVVPTLRSRPNAVGISVYLDAMLMGKCVVTSDGPGVSDLLSGEALVVPPEDSERLAASIKLAWEDDALRKTTAEAGHRYAVALGGEPELYQRILQEIVTWMGSGPHRTRSGEARSLGV